MPEIRRMGAWEQNLSHPDKEQGERDKRRTVSIVGWVVVGFVENPEERGVGIQGVGGIHLIIGLVNAHAIFVDGECAYEQIRNEPESEEVLFYFAHGVIGRYTSRQVYTC